MSRQGRPEVLLVRSDSAGDVLLMGPAVRAVAAKARVTMLVSPGGTAAAELLPGVSEVVTWDFPWSGYDPPPVDSTQLCALVGRLRRIAPTAAIIFTSYHQSPLPTALVLRSAGIGWIGATCEDYPGSLLDLRHRRPAPVQACDPTSIPGSATMRHWPEEHEVIAALDLVRAAGFHPPDGDLRLTVRQPLPRPDFDGVPTDRYVVVHPGAAVPARAAGPEQAARIVAALAEAGWPVVVTGSAAERPLTEQVSNGGSNGVSGGVGNGVGNGVSGGVGNGATGEIGNGVVDAGGATSLAQLGWLLQNAACVVVGNTGPAHLAAAVGTPVVSLFSPVVPASRWAPWGVPATLLGDQYAQCAGSGARTCPVPGHPCLDRIDPVAVVSAVAALAGRPSASSAPAAVPV